VSIPDSDRGQAEQVLLGLATSVEARINIT
jgi:hypothetical protein